MIDVGLIGYGYWGPNLARNIAESEGVRLTVIADGRPERRDLASRRHPGTTTCADAAEVIADAAVQAVIIATPLKTHHPLAKAALEAGKHVLVEKPLAASYAEASELAEIAARRGVCLMVDHTFVYTGAVRKIRALVETKELGDLLYLDSVRVNLGLFQQDSNVVWDLAAHDLAVMDHLVDARPVAVSADGTALAGYEHENIAYITVHFDNGFLGHFHVNWLAPVKVRTMLIGGSQRMLVYDDMEPSEKVRVYDKGVDFDLKDERAREQILVSYRTGDMYAPKLERREALASVVREFADAIEERRAPLTDGAAGIRVVQLLEAAERSLRAEGRRVRL
ncbi:MAG: oxidoreductase domain protein [Acidobacteria bacterium]|nr:oxidoreductase domain protein [Acidobacteriota bacterium]